MSDQSENNNEEPKLTLKQRMFVHEYQIDGNATQAAIRAGYSEDSAYSTGAENLTKPVIQAAIEKQTDLRLKALDVTAEYVISEILAAHIHAKAEDKSGDNLKALELLGKTAKIFTEKSEIANTGSVIQQHELSEDTVELFDKLRKRHASSD